MVAREIQREKNLAITGVVEMASVNTLMLAVSPMMGPKETKVKNLMRRDAVFLATKKGKKARKQLTSLLLKDLKEGEKGKVSPKGNESEDEDHLYQLIRGVPTVIIKAKEPVFDEFVPMREANVHDADVDGVDKGDMGHDTVFMVTLMMTGPPNGEDEVFVPSRENIESETDCERYEHEIDYRLWDIGNSKSL
jgi:hypothetical protein